MADILSNASDPELVNIAQQFRTVANANAAAYGLTVAQITDLTNAIQAFDTSLTAHVTAATAARTARTTKDTSRDVLEQILRSLARSVKSVTTVTEAQLTALGLPFGDSSGNAPSAATRPAGRVDTSERLRHTIHFTDEASPPNSKKKPVGVIGCEIFIKVDGAPPTDD